MTSFGKDSFRNANLGKHSLRKSSFGKAFLRKSNLGIESVHFLRESIHILEESFHFLKASMDFLKEPTDFLIEIWDVLRESVDLLDLILGINDFEACQLDILASWPNTIHIWTKHVFAWLGLGAASSGPVLVIHFLCLEGYQLKPSLWPHLFHDADHNPDP